ncbi:MAG: hypothetical protein M1837_004714 [Sclerophora amabilis]|nr:MAG: hypothetical protein M1837_004714 [Sclerophora amabilis]
MVRARRTSATLFAETSQPQKLRLAVGNQPLPKPRALLWVPTLQCINAKLNNTTSLIEEQLSFIRSADGGGDSAGTDDSERHARSSGTSSRNEEYGYRSSSGFRKVAAPEMQKSDEGIIRQYPTRNLKIRRLGSENTPLARSYEEKEKSRSIPTQELGLKATKRPQQRSQDNSSRFRGSLEDRSASFAQHEQGNTSDIPGHAESKQMLRKLVEELSGSEPGKAIRLAEELLAEIMEAASNPDGPISSHPPNQEKQLLERRVVSLDSHSDDWLGSTIDESHSQSDATSGLLPEEDSDSDSTVAASTSGDHLSGQPYVHQNFSRIDSPPASVAPLRVPKSESSDNPFRQEASFSQRGSKDNSSALSSLPFVSEGEDAKDAVDGSDKRRQLLPEPTSGTGFKTESRSPDLAQMEGKSTSNSETSWRSAIVTDDVTQALLKPGTFHEDKIDQEGGEISQPSISADVTPEMSRSNQLVAHPEEPLAGTQPSSRPSHRLGNPVDRATMCEYISLECSQEDSRQNDVSSKSEIRQTTRTTRDVSELPGHGTSALKRRKQPVDKADREKNEERPILRTKHTLAKHASDTSEFQPFPDFWTTAFERLSASSDQTMDPKSPLFEDARMNDQARTWALELIANTHKVEAMSHAWNKLRIPERTHRWPHIMLATLQSWPQHALAVLKATYTAPTPPDIAVTDALDYVTQYYLSRPGGARLRDVLDDLESMLHQVLDRSPYKRPHIEQRTIRRFLAEIDVEKASALFERLLDRSVPLNEDTLLHFLDVFAKNGRLEYALAIWKQILESEIDVSSTKLLSSCSTLLGEIGKNPQQHFRKSGIISEMLQYSVQPNMIISNIMIYNALSAGDVKGGWNLYELIKRKDMKPDEYTYSILLNNAKSRRDREAIDYLIVKINKDGYERDPHIVTDLLHDIYLSSNRSGTQSARSFNAMLSAYQRYYSTSALRDLGILNASSERFDVSSGLDLPQPPSPTLVVMIMAFIRHCKDIADLYTFYQRWKRLVHEGHPQIAPLASASEHISNLFIHTLGRSRDTLHLCPMVLTDMIHSLPKPDPRTVEDAAWDCSHPSASRDGPEADKSSDTSTDRPLFSQPTTQTFTILLSSYLRHRQFRAAEKVLSIMTSRGALPNQVTWNALINGYASVQDAKGAVRTLKRMEKDGWGGDSYTMRALGRIRRRQDLVREFEQAEEETATTKSAEWEERQGRASSEEAAAEKVDNEAASSDTNSEGYVDEAKPQHDWAAQLDSDLDVVPTARRWPKPVDTLFRPSVNTNPGDAFSPQGSQTRPFAI